MVMCASNDYTPICKKIFIIVLSEAGEYFDWLQFLFILINVINSRMITTTFFSLMPWVFIPLCFYDKSNPLLSSSSLPPSPRLLINRIGDDIVVPILVKRRTESTPCGQCVCLGVVVYVCDVWCVVSVSVHVCGFCVEAVFLCVCGMCVCCVVYGICVHMCMCGVCASMHVHSCMHALRF